MSFNIEDFEIEVWKRELHKALQEETDLKKSIEHDPVSVQMQCLKEFKELLDTYKGKDRLTPEFSKKVEELNKRDQAAKEAQDSYDIIKESDKLNNIRQKIWAIESKLNMLEFQRKRYK